MSEEDDWAAVDPAGYWSCKAEDYKNELAEALKLLDELLGYAPDHLAPLVSAILSKGET